MSKAEELAKELLEVIDGPAVHVPHYMARQSAAELRRLAQVEAEHAALLKAISDAEPVAYHRLIAGPYGDVWTVDSGIAKVKAYRPLYTLEGIRK